MQLPVDLLDLRLPRALRPALGRSATRSSRRRRSRARRRRGHRRRRCSRSPSRPTAGIVEAPLVVDALGWRRVLDDGYQPPDAPLSRGLEVHPGGAGDDLEIWIERGVVPAGYGWSFPADDELRVGVGSFDPRFHVKDPTVELAERLDLPPDGYQGNWIPHRLREATAAASSSAATRPATACR